MSYSDYSKTNVSTVDEIEEDEGAPAWMVTFADLVTLLLVFFVLLFTIATVEAQKFKLVASSIQVALNQDEPVADKISVSKMTPSGSTEEESVISCPENKPDENKLPEENTQNSNAGSGNKIKATKADDIQDLVKDIKGMIDQQRIGDYVYVYVDGDKVVLRIKGTVLFGSGNEALIEESRPIFAEINTLFNKYTDYKIDIKGYTDNVPIKTARFPSNWELSAVRATTVLRYFVDKGINPSRMSATGYADLFPVAENTTDEGRAKNRRVEFVLAKEK